MSCLLKKQIKGENAVAYKKDIVDCIEQLTKGE